MNLKILIFFLFLSFGSKAQNLKSLLERYRLQSREIDGIEFLISNAEGGKKPTIVFIRGSDFTPLFVNGYMIAFPFDLDSIRKKFNVIVLSKPGIPLASDSTQNRFLNESYTKGYYLNNDGKVPEEFVKNNNCEYYVKAHNSIIGFLTRQDWVDKNRIYVVGHSQGSNVAASMGLVNKKVRKVVLLSCNGSNRFYQSVRKIRYDENYGLFSGQVAQMKIDSVYSRYADLSANKTDNSKLFDSNTYLSYASFTFPSIRTKIIRLKQPTLLIYGTESLQDRDCDYLPFELRDHHKYNVAVKPYIGYDHNFFADEKDSDGKITGRIFGWDKVMKDVVNWLEIE